MLAYGFTGHLKRSGGRHNRYVFPNESEQSCGDRRNDPQLLYMFLSFFEVDGFLDCPPIVPRGDVGVGPFFLFHVLGGGEGNARSVADCWSLDKTFF